MIADPLLQFINPSLDGGQYGQDGNLGFRWDGVPERFREGRLRDHTNNIMGLLFKWFSP